MLALVPGSNFHNSFGGYVFIDFLMDDSGLPRGSGAAFQGHSDLLGKERGLNNQL